MTMSETDVDVEAFARSGHCCACGETVVVDGESAGVICGQLFCKGCLGREAQFVTECLDCDWTYTAEGRATQRYHLRMRVQQEGNGHEDEHRVFDDDPNHETVWREVRR